MTNLRNLLLTAAVLAILPGATARAGNVSISFDFPILTAKPGQTVTFRGTITNLESTFVDLNGCGVTLGGQFTTDNCSLFFTNAPLFLNPNETNNGPFDMFTVTVDLPYTDPYGLRSGTFTVLGFVEPAGNGPTDGSTLNVLDEQRFGVAVVPEPGSAVLLALALPVALALRRRSHRLRARISPTACIAQ